jgi:hypothetical protein
MAPRGAFARLQVAVAGGCTTATGTKVERPPSFVTVAYTTVDGGRVQLELANKQVSCVSDKAVMLTHVNAEVENTTSTSETSLPNPTPAIFTDEVV